jgi:proteasome lid subunit RPN8/RPN11
MLIIKKTDLQTIHDHCAAGCPNEACGMLAGKNGRIEKVYLMTNAKPDPNYYEMEPDEQFRVMNEIRQSGLELVGMFHSHPTGRAYPSSVDVEKAYWPGTLLPNYPDAVYVIVSLMDRAHPVVKGYLIDAGSVTEVPVKIVPE